jgi:predicted HicB family RNase H-like nuclease
MNEKREALNLRVPAELKRKIEEYASRFGITLNAAACVLLTGAVDRDGR